MSGSSILKLILFMRREMTNPNECVNISRSDWLGALGIALFLVSILLGIVNNRRILADKRPWGDL